MLQRLLGIADDGIFGNDTDRAVRNYQRTHGLFPDGVVGQLTWARLKAPKNEAMPALKKSKRVINKIIVHCTATPEGKEVSVKDIDAWHRARGFAGIGYHYVIHLDGKVEEGRDVDRAGAHTAGYNAYSVGVSYVGGVAKDGCTPKDTRTPEQKEALLTLLRRLRKLYPTATIHGHREFAAKACPSFDAKKEYKGI